MIGSDTSIAVRLSPRKNEYSLEEAARALGLGVTELRALLIHHVVHESESVGNIPKMKFRPADLVMLSAVARESGYNGYPPR